LAVSRVQPFQRWDWPDAERKEIPKVNFFNRNRLAKMQALRDNRSVSTCNFSKAMPSMAQSSAIGDERPPTHHPAS
jgi:hypothetical protein